MNHVYRLVWNADTQRYVPAPETARSHGKSGQSSKPGRLRRQGTALLLAGVFGLPAHAQLAADALPTGGEIIAGQASLAQSGNQLTITQGTDKAILHWQGFDIGSNAAVNFDQPSAGAVALNRVLASDASRIEGRLTANGQVWLINPNGVIFGQGSRVDVGGLVASTLDTTDEDFLSGQARFSRNGANGAIENHGNLTARDGGLIALLAPQVSNDGIITARLGNVVMAAGEQITLEAGANGFLQVAIDPATIQTLIDNRQLIVADGGQVLMTGKAADALSSSIVANSGTVQARTLQERDGRILLLADMEHGEVRHDGLLDASAPDGGDGGFVETSAAKVSLSETARVTTKAEAGQTGTWLIDPNDYTIAASGGDITGALLSTNLGSNNIEIQSSAGGSAGNGDINVNDAVSWSANTLTLTAARDININAVMTASGDSQLVMNTGTANGSDAAVADGRVRVGLSPGEANGFAGRVDFPDRSGSGFLTINGSGYYVLGVNDLGVAGDATTTTLQGIKNNLVGKYALGANIDASSTVDWHGGAGFMPIGDNSYSFTGHLNGLGHVIDGLYINRPSGANNVGLISTTRGYGHDPEISNLGLTNVDITGPSIVGGLVGQVIENLDVHNVHVSGDVRGTSSYIGGLIGFISFYAPVHISHAFSSANVFGKYNVGGLIGYASTCCYSNIPLLVENSGTAGTVNVAEYGSGGGFIGGLAVYGTGNIARFQNIFVLTPVLALGSGDYYRGSFAGQIQARDTSTLEFANVYAAGEVQTTSSSMKGLFGRADRYESGVITLNGVFWDTQTSGTNNIAGYNGAGVTGAYGLTTAEMRTLANFNSATAANGNVDPAWDISGNTGDDTIWRIYDGASYPVLRAWQTTPVVTANDAGKVYDGDLWSGGNGYSGAPVTGTPVWAGDSQGAKNAGQHDIQITGGLTLDRSSQMDYQFWNDDPIVFQGGTLTITPKVLDTNLTAQDKVYDGTNAATLDGSASLSGMIGADDVQLQGTVDETLFEDADAGEDKTVVVGGLSLIGVDAGNYTLGRSDALILKATIIPKTLTVTDTTASGKTYDGTTTANITAGTLSGFVDSETVTIASASGTFDSADAGDRSATASYILADGTNGGKASNYTLADTTGHTATIDKALLTVTADDQSRSYGAANPTFSQTITGFVNNEDATSAGITGSATGSSTATNTTGVGDYTIIGSTGDLAAANYSFTAADGTLTIDPAQLTVTADDQSRSYGAANPVFSQTITGFVNGENASSAGITGSATGSSTATTTTGVGDYTISGSIGDLAAANYSFAAANGTLTIDPAQLTVTADDQSRSYGAANPTFSQTITGFVNGENATSAGITGSATGNSTATNTTGVGDYTISGSIGDLAAANYSFAAANGTLTVTQRPITVTADNQSRAYGDANPATGNVTVTSGSLANSDALGTATLTAGSATATANAGTTHDLTPSAQIFTTGLAGNYDITYADGTLTITQRPITITADNQSRAYGNANPATGSVTVTSGSLANSDALGTATLTAGSATATANAGTTHDLTPSAQTFTAGLAGNYTITYNDGTLTIDKAPATVTANSSTATYTGQAQSVTGFSVEGLVNDEDESVLSIATSGGVGTAVGEYPHIASGSADNYELTFVDGSLTIEAQTTDVPGAGTVSTQPAQQDMGQGTADSYSPSAASGNRPFVSGQGPGLGADLLARGFLQVRPDFIRLERRR